MLVREMDTVFLAMSWVLGRNRAGKLGYLAKVPWVLGETSSIPLPCRSSPHPTVLCRKLGDKVSKIRAHQKSTFSSQTYWVLRREQSARLGEESFPPHPPVAI